MAATELWMVAAIGAPLLLALGAGLAWQRHRARLAEMQRRLAWSEESRFQLVQHAEAVDARLAELSEVLARQRQALRAAREGGGAAAAAPQDRTASRPSDTVRQPVAAPAELMAQAVAQAQASAGLATAGWADTEPQPLEPCAEPPEPADARAGGTRPPTPHPAWVADATTVPAALDPPLRRRTGPRD